jgi:hypothetical protein
MIQSYLNKIKKGDSDAMVNLGYYYEHENIDYKKSIKYFLMAIEKGNTIAMICLGDHYIKIKKDYNLMMKYYLMAIEKNDSSAMHNLSCYCDENDCNFDFYKKLKQMKNKNLLILNKIDELKKNKDVINYETKIAASHKDNNYKICPLCLEDNILNIDLTCGKHQVCINCYDINLQCVYNFCKESNKKS